MRDFRELNQQINEIKRMLNSFIQKLTANRTGRKILSRNIILLTRDTKA